MTATEGMGAGSMDRRPYEYVALRCVPRVDREEFVNVGVVLHCQAEDFLVLASRVDDLRLRALWPELDVHGVTEALHRAEAVCRGEDWVGDVASKDLKTRFGFLKAPKSTVVQAGPVHGGLTSNPQAELDRLLRALVP